MSQRPWLVEDGAIERRDQDRFDHLSVTQQLSDSIRESTQPFAVGLLGPFGSGKSSVVKLLATELAVNKKWAVLHVSAEHHSGVARARGLVYALLDAAKRQGLITPDDHASERACLEGSRQHTLPRPSPTASRPGKPGWRRSARVVSHGLFWCAALTLAIWLYGAVLVTLCHWIGVGRNVSALSWFTQPGAGALTAMLASAAVVAAMITAVKDGVLQVLKGYEITVTSPRPDTTDELQQVFSRLVGRIHRRLVIAIDDIDRLAAADVLEALTTVRSLLLTGTHHGHPPVFVISCDESIVREAIVGIRPGGLAHRPVRPDGEDRDNRESERKAAEEAVQEYLNKLFTVRFTLPAHHDTDLRDYAEHLLTHPQPHPIVQQLGGLAAVRNVLDVLIHRQVRDPRHAIRLLNSFLSDCAVARRREQPSGDQPPRIAAGEVSDHPVALARLIVLRHDFRSLYDRIAAEHQLLYVLDDALLGSVEAMQDPLVKGFMKDGAERFALDQEPGLVYLRATAARARIQQPPDISALLYLGSKPASRILGSQTATAIQSELAQRDSEAFAVRLTVQDERERVLRAAAQTVSAARTGQDLDNSLAATVRALGQEPQLTDHVTADDECGQAVVDLTDRIMNRLDEAAIPIPAHDLVGVLDLVRRAHIRQLYASLRLPPEQQGDQRDWAQALLRLRDPRHVAALRPSLESYFGELAKDGPAEELGFWMAVWDTSTPDEREQWPAHAYGALLAMAARCGDDLMMDKAAQATLQTSGSHGWQRPVIEGLLEALSSSEAMIAGNAVQLLHRVTVPADGWGRAVDPAAADNGEITLAAEIVDAAAVFLNEDNDEECSVRTAELLHAWIPAVTELVCLSGNPAGSVIATVVSQTADTCEGLARTAGEVLLELPTAYARECVDGLVKGFSQQRSPDSAIGQHLHTALVSYVRSTDAAAEGSKEAATAQVCLAALTASLEEDSKAGQFTRTGLPAVLSTARGVAAAPDLAARLVPAIPVPPTPHAQEILRSLHLLFNDTDTRVTHLAPALGRLQNYFNYNQPELAVKFAASYPEESAVTTQWLSWISQYWAHVPTHARDRIMAVADKPEIRQAALPELLAQHLLSSTEPSVWASAPKLWDSSNTERKADIIAAASGRCPQLADQVANADLNTLTSALCKASGHLNEALKLMTDNPQTGKAITQYLEQTIDTPEWKIDNIHDVVTEIPDPTLLWDYSLQLTAVDMSHTQKTAQVIEALARHHPESAPSALVETLAPVLINADPATAAALGKALRPLPEYARKLHRSLRGHSKTTEQRNRTKAYKQAAGI